MGHFRPSPTFDLTVSRPTPAAPAIYSESERESVGICEQNYVEVSPLMEFPSHALDEPLSSHLFKPSSTYMASLYLSQDGISNQTLIGIDLFE
jgi:hypothetical protein